MANPGLGLTNLDYNTLLKKKKKLGIYDPLALNTTPDITNFPIPADEQARIDAAALGTLPITTDNSGTVVKTAITDPTILDVLSQTFAETQKNKELQKKYLIGSTIGQGLLNLTNLSQIILQSIVNA